MVVKKKKKKLKTNFCFLPLSEYRQTLLSKLSTPPSPLAFLLPLQTKKTMAAILARSSASAVVSARRSQAEPKRSVSAAAWQKAITEAELQNAEVSFFTDFSLFCRTIKTAVSLFGNHSGERKALELHDTKEEIECAVCGSGPRAIYDSTRSKKL